MFMKIYSGTTTLSNDGFPSGSKWARPVKRARHFWWSVR